MFWLKRPKSWPKFIAKCLFLYTPLLFLTAIIYYAGLLYAKGFFEMPDFSKLNDSRQASRMYDRAGAPLRAYCNYCREILPLEAMGGLPQAAVEVEDHRFWNFTRRWSPFDFIRIGYAMVTNIIKGRIVMGGSGVTNQLTRNGLLEDELRRQYSSDSAADKWWRKGRETWIAPLVQNMYTREEILKLYMNSNYCGYGIYGVSLCSWYWFDKKAHELNPADQSWIFLLWRNPSHALLENLEVTREARSRVLRQMVDRKLIKANEFKIWNEYPLPKPRQPHTQNPAPQFTEWLRRQFIEKTRLVDTGLNLHTTLDSKLQRVAAEALQKVLAEMQEKNPELTDLRACTIVMDRSSGAILAWAENTSFADNQFLLCSQAKPQTGSAIKPLFYALWLKKGGRLSCADEGTGPCRLHDSPGITIPMGEGKEPHRIQNFPVKDRQYLDICEALLCLAESKNAGTMSGVEGTFYSNAERFTVPDPDHEGKFKKVRINLEEMLAFALELGITLETYKGDLAEANKLGILLSPTIAERLKISPATINPGLTLPIGSLQASPLEMAVTLTTLTTGKRVEPYGLEFIKNPSGNTLEPDRTLPKMVFYKKVVKEINIGGKPVPIEEIVPDEKLILSITRGLRSTIELPHGTGQLARNGKWDEKNQVWITPKLDFQVCGKTGTATRGVRDKTTGKTHGETTDNWFIGCTPSYVSVTWIGRDKKLPLMKPEWEGKTTGQFTGGSTAIRVFIDIIKALYETRPKEIFPEGTDPTKPFYYPVPAATPQTPSSAEAPSEDSNTF